MKNYCIDEKLMRNGETITTNVRRCKCYADGCPTILEKGEGFPIFIPSRGQRYVCRTHANNNCLLGYHGNARRNSNNVIGTSKKGIASVTVGTEIEVHNNYLSSAEKSTLRALLESCFLTKAESDCTVSAEFPTEKMQGLATISKVLQSIEKHGLIEAVNNENCGAHVHVYCNDVPYLRRYMHSVFMPLNDYIKAMDDTNRIAFFGRDFCHWARPINYDSNPLEHANMFNLQHEHTIEFRLPRITSHKQYMEVLKFWREIGAYINEYDFCKNGTKEERKAHAQSCGAHLVKIAKKYF